MFRHHLVWALVVWLLLTFSSCGGTTVEKDYGVKEEDEEPYTFEQYLEEYDKNYADPEDYTTRRAVFYQNLDAIQKHNHRQKGGNDYTLAVNQFTDLLPEQVPMGYVKSLHPLMSVSDKDDSTAMSRRLVKGHELESFLTTKPVSDLPKHVDWREKGITTPVKSQHQCGSCWAFASTAVIESHVAKNSGTLYSLSEQELVSCASNPLHCGGTGGCSGSTAEIAMEFVRQNGIVDEWTFGYESTHGETVECILERNNNLAMIRGGPMSQYFHGAVATIEGWITLPRNNYTAVMNVLSQLGPVTVTVACSPWISYKSGVYSGELKTRKETDINHLVVLEGYGTDEETGEDYWLVRNSWGPRWGESGYIRLKRVDPATLDDPDADCGVDVTPADGVACTVDENGDPVPPPNARICGNSGVLYDVTVPLGAHLI
mmetsp:Transcript_11363/g.21694  ORF Transcript_11363/g.21694 Transcript_11363/m.21694 type:complete len:430 (+) Transcript_11363:54-1343(+)|eukprot:scaffold1055_cov165-Amphora_coffeaeformis.AAC.17